MSQPSEEQSAMKMDVYAVVECHVSTFPDPKNLKAGDTIRVGSLYEGNENWPGWYLCSTPDQGSGYVPEQILAHHSDGFATLREDYTNRELSVATGALHGTRQLNGWLWATRQTDGATGWVPLSCLTRNDAMSG
jgi:hypothetical protein